MLPSFHVLPTVLVHRILDHLDILTIILSLRNVCTQINTAIDTYQRYKVNLIISMPLILNSLLLIGKHNFGAFQAEVCW
jgi:hypothetical protein